MKLLAGIHPIGRPKSGRGMAMRGMTRTWTIIYPVSHFAALGPAP